MLEVGSDFLAVLAEKRPVFRVARALDPRDQIALVRLPAGAKENKRSIRMSTGLCFIGTRPGHPNGEPRVWISGMRGLSTLALRAFEADPEFGVAAMGRYLMSHDLTVEEEKELDFALADDTGRTPLPMPLAAIEQPVAELLPAAERFLELQRARDRRLKIVGMGGPDEPDPAEHEEEWAMYEEVMAEFVKELKQSMAETDVTHGILLFC
jgi:hypothetical protein